MVSVVSPTAHVCMESAIAKLKRVIFLMKRDFQFCILYLTKDLWFPIAKLEHLLSQSKSICQLLNESNSSNLPCLINGSYQVCTCPSLVCDLLEYLFNANYSLTPTLFPLGKINPVDFRDFTKTKW